MTNGTVETATARRLLPVANPTGPAVHRLLLVGDGYTEAAYKNGITTFADDAQTVVDAVQREPWYQALPSETFQVWAVDVYSAETGIDNEPNGGSPGHRTYFNAKYGVGAWSRVIDSHNPSPVATARNKVQNYTGLGFTGVCVLTNSAAYGGSKADGVIWVAGHASYTAEVFLHEFGHWCGLYDEYTALGAAGTGNPLPPGNDLDHPNVDDSDWMAVATELNWHGRRTDGLTTTASATYGSYVSNDLKDPALVGAFEGAGYFTTGAWRPSFACRMNSVDSPYCTVCEEQVVKFLSTP